MTLTEFLLARIAEDAAVARDADTNRIHLAPDLSIDTWVCDDFGTHVGASPARVLAECEAKRRIVEAHSGPHTCSTGRRFEHSRSGAIASGQYVTSDCPTLGLLAQPYADHPDFDEAWTIR